MRIQFTVNRYDKDGDITKECIMLHFGKNHIVEIKDLKKLDSVIENLKIIKKEIKENY